MNDIVGVALFAAMFVVLLVCVCAIESRRHVVAENPVVENAVAAVVVIVVSPGGEVSIGVDHHDHVSSAARIPSFA